MSTRANMQLRAFVSAEVDTRIRTFQKGVESMLGEWSRDDYPDFLIKHLREFDKAYDQPDTMHQLFRLAYWEGGHALIRRGIRPDVSEPTFNEDWEHYGLSPRLTDADLEMLAARPDVAGFEEGLTFIISEWLVSGGPITAGRNLALLGDPGTGKTTLAVICMKRALWCGFSAKYMTTSRLARVLRSAERQEANAHMNAVVGVSLLVLDDWAAEYGSDFSDSIMSEVLETRHDRKLSTIITSNLYREALQERAMDLRTWDRFASECTGMLEFRGQSARGQQ